jgi:hypothetical protein
MGNNLYLLPMSAIGNGQQSMPITNLELKIKKNHKTLYALYLYIHVYKYTITYMLSYTKYTLLHPYIHGISNSHVNPLN